MLRRLLLMLLAGATIQASAQSKSEKVQAVESSVAGTVKDSQNAPVKGAQAHFVDSIGRDTIALTDAEGKFSIPQLKPGAYQVKADQKFYGASPSQTLRINGAKKGVALTLKTLDKPPVRQLTTADLRPFLPEGPGKDLFSDKCGNCHSSGIALSVGPLDRKGWESVIKSLSYIETFDEVVTQEHIGPLLDYLTKYFGPGSTLIGELGAKVKKAYREEVPLGRNVIYQTYKLPWKAAEPHTSVSDGKGNVWVTGYGVNKVGRLELSTGKVTDYDLKTPKMTPFGMDIAPDGKVWFSAGLEIGVIDPATGTLKEFKVPTLEGEKPYRAGHVVIKDGKVWFSWAFPGQIKSFDPETQKFTSYPIEDGKFEPAGISKHGDKLLFALQHADKAVYLKPATGEVEVFPVPTSRIPAPMGIEHLRGDQKGRVWMGDQDKHKLWMLEPATKRLQSYDMPYDCKPYTVRVDSRGMVWAVCFRRETLIEFDPETKKMTEYPQPSGSGGVARSLEPDPDGSQWFANWYDRKVVNVKVVP